MRGQARGRGDAAGTVGCRFSGHRRFQVCCCELGTGGEAKREERKREERREEARNREREKEKREKGNGGREGDTEGKKSGERTREKKQEKGERDRDEEKESMCKGVRKDAAQGVLWFGNSRGVAILECGEIALGSQEAKGSPVPGHNNSLSVALTHSGLSTPRDATFTQAQNVSLPQLA